MTTAINLGQFRAKTELLPDDALLTLNLNPDDFRPVLRDVVGIDICHSNVEPFAEIVLECEPSEE